METQFKWSRLAVPIEEIWDEADGENVLTFVSFGVSCTGYLTLVADYEDEGLKRWRWQVTEPEGSDTYTGDDESMVGAANALKSYMADMDEVIRQRSEGQREQKPMSKNPIEQPRFFIRMGWLSLILAFVSMGFALISFSYGGPLVESIVLAGVFLFSAEFNWWAASKA